VTITYYSSRREVWDWYWFMWRRSVRLKVKQLAIAVGVFLAAWTVQSQATSSPSARVLVAVAVTCLVLAMLPIYPLLMFKPQRRQLTIGEPGISTTVGAVKAEVPWREVAEILSWDDSLLIIGRNLNAFIIPSRAFETQERREVFERSAKDWFQHGKSGSAV
jgi:hypothetical protein